MPTKKMLIVDDQEINRELLKAIFKKEYEIFLAENDQVALDVVNKTEINVIVLDIIMPVMDGFKFLQILRSNEKTADLPVIVVTAGDQTDVEIKALDLGATDYVSKPFDNRVIQHRVNNVVRKKELEDVKLENELLKERTKSAEQLRHRALYDPLTNIYNRESFIETTKELFKNNPNKDYALIRFNIDRFKLLNELFGRNTCDSILQEMAEIIDSALHGIGTYGRLNADHFAVCFPLQLLNIESLDRSLRESFVTKGRSFDMVINAGIYVVLDKAVPVEKMLDLANLALSSIKGNFSVRYAYYSEKMREEILHDQMISGEMVHALNQNQFVIYLQPQFNHATHQLIGCEALVRWNHPKKGVIPPSVFIPVFERNGFISALDEYVWELACKTLRKWIDEKQKIIPISVNLSRVDVYNAKLCDIISGLADKYKVPHNLLRLEITESAYVQSPEHIIKTVKELQGRGFYVEMDDFGSAYSSLNTLKDVPVDLLKLDMKFLSDNGDKVKGGNILNSIVRMAHWLSLPVIAEGVETVAQADFLKSIGCDFVQGYLYARPMPVDDFEKMKNENETVVPEGKFPLEAYIDTNDIWNPSSLGAVLFNVYVGAAGIFEYHEGNIETLMVNDKCLKEISISREMFFNKTKDNIVKSIFSQDMKKLNQAILTAIDTKSETPCEVRYTDVMTNRNRWLRLTLTLLANRDDRYIFFVAFEDITQLKNYQNDAVLNVYSKSMYNTFDEIYELDFEDMTSTMVLSRYKNLEYSGEKSNLKESFGLWVSKYVEKRDRQRVLDFVLTAPNRAVGDGWEDRIEFGMRNNIKRKLRCMSLIIAAPNKKFLLCNLNLTQITKK